MNTPFTQRHIKGVGGDADAGRTEVDTHIAQRRKVGDLVGQIVHGVGNITGMPGGIDPVFRFQFPEVVGNIHGLWEIVQTGQITGQGLCVLVQSVLDLIRVGLLGLRGDLSEGIKLNRQKHQGDQQIGNKAFSQK